MDSEAEAEAGDKPEGKPFASRFANFPEAPVFHPTPKEFSDPAKYIESISDQARPFGICKIVPPPNWKPPFVLDREKFAFRTRVQQVNFLDGQARLRLTFVENLCRFMARRGTPLERLPVVDFQTLDLCRLFREVNKRGGMTTVTDEKRWAEVARTLGHQASSGSTIRQHYHKILYPYELYKKRDSEAIKKEGSHDSAAAAPSETPEHAESKTEEIGAPIVTSEETTGMQTEENDTPTVKSEETAAATITIAANGASGVDTCLPDALNAVEHSEIALAASILALTPSQVDGTEQKSESGDSRTRSADAARIKQEADLSDMALAASILASGSTPQGAGGDDDQKSESPLEYHFVRGPDGSRQLVSCRANRAEPSCGAGGKAEAAESDPDDTYSWTGYHDGQRYTLGEYETMADQFKSTYFAGREAPGEEEMEEAYWKIVESPEQSVEVEYGSELHSTLHGSGFPTSGNPLNPLDGPAGTAYTRSPWNLTNLSSHSLLRHVQVGWCGSCSVTAAIHLHVGWWLGPSLEPRVWLCARLVRLPCAGTRSWFGQYC